MKNLKHLLVALLVMGAIGCTTDTVENEINPMQGTTILNVDIPNPQTKVGLGEKGEDGKYPMHWCSGDKISVNGNISEEAVINPDNTCSAQFEFKSAVLNYPYNVLYPASTDGTVEFATTQNYVEGTFAQGAAPMCGYVANNGDKANLTHLAGVLRFPVKATTEGTTLQTIVITSTDGAKLSGEFL